MKLQLLLYLYFVVVQSAIQLDSSYLIDEFTESTSTNPYIDDSQTIFVVVGDEGYQPSYDPATVRMKHKHPQVLDSQLAKRYRRFVASGRN